MNIERLQSQSTSFSQARSAAHVTEWTVGILDESYTWPAEGAVICHRRYLVTLKMIDVPVKHLFFFFWLKLF